MTQESKTPPTGARQENVQSGTVHGYSIQSGDITTLNIYGGPDTPAPAAAPSPQQLPADVATFVNRAPAIAAAAARLRTEPRPGITPVAVITGGPGVGKTALATRCAHSLSEHYRHGQLFLRFDPDGRSPSDMVEGLLRAALRALDVAPELHPPKLSDLAALYRSVLAPLSVLIVIDGATVDAEVKPLIPASPTSAVVITSRHRLGEIEADAEVIALEPLAPDAALTLLGAIAGPDRVAREPEAAARLVELCGRLPIAVRLLGRRIAVAADRPLARFVATLEDPRTRLGRLGRADGPPVAHIFDEAVRGLDPEPRRAYALLALHPGASFDRWSAAALLDTDEDEAEELLDRLADAGMLETDRERYRFNSLVLSHAAALAQAELAETQRLTARVRVIEWYRIQAYRADCAAFGPRLRLGAGAIEARWRELQGPAFSGAGDALDWLETERAGLLSAQAMASAAGLDVVVWHLAEALWALFNTRGHVADAVEAYTQAITAADRLDDGLAHAQIGKQLAALYRKLGDLARAEQVLDQALAALPAHGAERMTASLSEAVGKIRLLQGALPQARAAFERARAVNAEFGWERGRLLQEVMLGVVLREEGDLTGSLETLTGAAAGLARFDARNQARVAAELAVTAGALGRREQALEQFLVAAGVYLELGERLGEIAALLGAADHAEALQRTQDARHGLERVALLCMESGDTVAAADVRERIARLTAPE